MPLWLSHEVPVMACGGCAACVHRVLHVRAAVAAHGREMSESWQTASRRAAIYAL